MQDNLEDIKQIISNSQHCQRNWDLSQQIPEEHIQMLVYAATQCPSKQNDAWYKLHFVTNRQVIEQLHVNTDGFFFKPPEIKTNNPQILANLIIVFEKNYSARKKKFDLQWNIPYMDRTRTVYMNTGVAAGYVNFVSTLLGYKTGFCGCMQRDQIQSTLNLENEPVLLLGIGFADANRNRLEHHLNPNIVFPSFAKEKIEINFIK